MTYCKEEVVYYFRIEQHFLVQLGILKLQNAERSRNFGASLKHSCQTTLCYAYRHIYTQRKTSTFVVDQATNFNAVTKGAQEFVTIAEKC